MAKKPDRAKHVAHAKQLKADVEAELGTYAEGGPAVVVTRVEWDGLTKKVDVATDDDLGEITSVVLHVK